MASNKTSNQTSENQNDNQWPRFLIMEAADQKVPLNLNAFVLKKAIDGMANAELDNVKPMKSGSVFIEVETKQQIQKSPEDNQATGLFTCESFTTQNPKFIKICHQMRGTGQDGRRRNQKRTSTTRNHCCQKDIHTIQSVRFNHQRTNYSKKDQYWISEKRNTTVHSQPSKMFSMPEIWTYQEFV